MQSTNFARVIEATGSVPSQEDLSDAFARIGRAPVSADDYAMALVDVTSLMEVKRKAIEASFPAPSLPVAIGTTMPLAVLGVTALAVKAYWVAVLVFGLAGIFIYGVLQPRSRLAGWLPWVVGLKRKPQESPSRHQLRSGVAVILLGALFLFGSIWGRSALYASGMARGDQPLLEVMLMIPMPLLGVTLLLWGMGKALKGLVGLLSGEEKP